GNEDAGKNALVAWAPRQRQIPEGREILYRGAQNALWQGAARRRVLKVHEPRCNAPTARSAQHEKKARRSYAGYERLTEKLAPSIAATRLPSGARHARERIFP